MSQESRTLLAITFLLAALFVAMNRIVDSAPLSDWWLALALFVGGVILALSSRFDLARGRTHEEVAAEAAAPALQSRVHVYEFAASSAPQLGASPGVMITDVPLPIDDGIDSALPSTDDIDLDDVNVDEPAPPPLEEDDSRQ